MSYKIIRALKWLFPTVIAGLIFLWGIDLWVNRNLLKQYGVVYEKSYGEHESFQEIQFYWNRGGKRIIGPKISGDDLYVRFKYVAHDEVPEIVVLSRDYTKRYVILKLNFKDPSKSEFEIVENQMMGVHYPPLGYYGR